MNHSIELFISNKVKLGDSSDPFETETLLERCSFVLDQLDVREQQIKRDAQGNLCATYFFNNEPKFWTIYYYLLPRKQKYDVLISSDMKTLRIVPTISTYGLVPPDGLKF